MMSADSPLARIASPADLKALSDKELEQLAHEMREELIRVVGLRSAHFASNLGVVELCLALHLTYDFGADESSRRALDDYGRAVGLAFQIVDDLLDVQGDEAKLGKRVRKDSRLGKWAYPGLLGIEGSRARAGQLADEAVAALAPLGDRAATLRALALDLLERDR